MPALNSKDMTNPASGGPYAGESRDAIFQLKIKEKRPFILGSSKNGKEVIGVKYEKNKKTISYYIGNKKSVVTTVAYTKIFKDKDFGGGAGSGGGAEDTKWTESLQCYYCSYVFNFAKGKIKKASDDDLKRGAKFVVAPSLKDCLEKGPSDWIENDVYLKTANKLYEKFGKVMRGGVYFHRGSPFMDSLYKAKKAAHDIDRKSKSPQAPGSFSNDKWNPGDIWASTEIPSSKPLSESTGSWGELNAEVYSRGEKGTLLGISLKKIGVNAPAKLTEYNTPKTQSRRESYTYTGYTYGKTGNFFQSQDIYLHTNVGDVQFRTFGGETAWQGEIKGGAAAGGKIGGGNVDFYCHQVFGKGIYKGLGTEKSLIQWIKSNQDGDYQETLYKLYKKHNGSSKPSGKILTEEDFYASLADKDFKFKNSKLICMLFLDVLESGSTKKQHEFITKMFRYAQSDVDQSSYFVKIY
jgi:hypothetical protein